MPRGRQIEVHRQAETQSRAHRTRLESRGTSKDEAERRAWATVNAMDHGGKKEGGSGRGTPQNKAPAKRAAKKAAKPRLLDPKPRARFR